MKTIFATAAIMAAFATPVLAKDKVPLPKPAPIQVATVAVGEPLPYRVAPAPGKAVIVGGYLCLMMAPDDVRAECNMVGKIYLPTCRDPVFIKGTDIDRLVCLDQASVARN